MIPKSGEVIEIDTKEICLLCYDLCVKGAGDEVIKRASSLTGLKQLLRYLKVDTKQLFNCSPGILQWMEIKHEIDVQISLCANCLLVTEEFDKVYKEYELIQFQFDKCLASLHQSMKSGDNNPDRVREFQKQMQPNKSFDLINASIAANLRDETFKKCSLKLKNSVPRVTVHKILPKNDEEDDDDKDHNHVNQIPISLLEPISCQLNSFETKRKDTLTTVNQLQVDVRNESNGIAYTNEDIEDWQSSSDGSFEVPEDDPLGTDTDLDDEDADEVSIPVPLSTPNSPASELNSSMDPPSNSTGRSQKSSKICDICNKTISRALRDHKFLVHPEYSIFKRFASASKLSLVECKALADNFIQQAVVTSVTSNSNSFGKRTVKCCYCSKILSSRQVFKAHLVNKHMEQIVDFERKQNQSTSSHQAYNHSMTDSTIYSCNYCTYISPSSVNLKDHEIDKHIVDVIMPYFGPGTCPIKCARGVNAYFQKLIEMDNKCPICSSLMTDIYSCRRHIYGQHFSDFINQVKECLVQCSNDDSGSVECASVKSTKSCDICNRSFTDAQHQRRHYFTVHSEYSIFKHCATAFNLSLADCKKLGDKFTEEAVAKSVRGKKSVKCCYCGKILSAVQAFKAHILSLHMDKVANFAQVDSLTRRERRTVAEVAMSNGNVLEYGSSSLGDSPGDVENMEIESENAVKVEADNENVLDSFKVDYLE